MAARWNIAKYNRAIKAIRKEHPKLDIARARATWKNLSARLGKSASTVDVRKSALRKRGAKSSELSRAVQNSAAQTRREAVSRRATEKPGRLKSGSMSVPSVRGKEKAGKRGRFREALAPQKTIPIKRLSDWRELWDEDLALQPDLEIAAGVDTGKAGKK